MSTSADSLTEQMVQMLRTSLRIPRANRTVSDFLFGSLLDSVFHPAHPLPPASLATSFALHLQLTIDPVPNPLYPPACHHKPVPSHVLAEQPASTGLQVSDNHAIFIPVATVAPYTLGYALFHDPNHETICLRANPFSTPFAARFVYDVSTEDLLLVTYAGSPPSIGIRAYVNSGSPCREHYMIAVPPVPYEWPHLPTTPLWMVSNIEFRQSKTISEISSDFLPSDDDVNVIDASSHPVLSQSAALRLLDEALATDPIPSHNKTLPTPASSLQPWPLSSNGQLADGLSPPALGAPGNGNSTSSSMFRAESLKSTLSCLQNSFNGTFYAPSMRLDFTPNNSSFTGRAAHLMRTASSTLTAEMRDRFAALYYMSVLPVSADTPLLRPAARRALPVLPGCSACCQRASNIKPMPSEPEWRIASYPVDDVHDFFVGIPGEKSLPPLGDEFEFSDFTTDQATVTERPLGGHHRKDITTELISTSAETNAHAVGSVICKRIGQASKTARLLRPRPSSMLVGTQPSLASRSTITLMKPGTEGNKHVSANETDICGCPSSDQKEVVDPKASREKMLQARKMRNRLSAARSNEKRKARFAALESDVANGRERLKVLHERHRDAAEENARLRELIKEQSGLKT